MSKLYDAYKYCKKNNNEERTLFLFKAGIFYLFLDEDAKIASNILNLKLTYLNDTVLKCGFPTSALNKYSILLAHHNYKLKIIDTSTKNICEVNQIEAKEKIKILVEELSKIDIDNCSVSEVYEKLEKYIQMSKEILQVFYKY